MFGNQRSEDLKQRGGIRTNSLRNNFETHWRPHANAPLSPPRPPRGEGEPFCARRTIQTYWLSTAQCALFPLPELPEGEGQGEGKRRERPARVPDQSRNCRTGRVLLRSRRFPPQWQ